MGFGPSKWRKSPFIMDWADFQNRGVPTDLFEEPYDFDSGSGKRIVKGVHHGVGVWNNAAHRIRSGSFDAICNHIEDNPSSFFPYPGC
jgi:hypothetical protein